VSAGRRDDDAFDSRAVVVSGECRPLRRSLRPVVWVVFEEVALDAVAEDGRLVARTSARQIAERLGVNPSTAAEALRVLSRRGLVSLEREKGQAGRFGLSVYQLAPVAGLSVVQPLSTAQPRTAERFTVSPSMRKPETAEPGVSLPYVESPASDTPDPSRPDQSMRATPGGDTVSTVGFDRRPGATNGDDSARRPARCTDSPGTSRRGARQTALDLGMGPS
jgi:DNA-binding transcriptional ArsR family regulator